MPCWSECSLPLARVAWPVAQNAVKPWKCSLTRQAGHLVLAVTCCIRLGRHNIKQPVKEWIRTLVFRKLTHAWVSTRVLPLSPKLLAPTFRELPLSWSDRTIPRFRVRDDVIIRTFKFVSAWFVVCLAWLLYGFELDLSVRGTINVACIDAESNSKVSFKLYVNCESACVRVWVTLLVCLVCIFLVSAEGTEHVHQLLVFKIVRIGFISYLHTISSKPRASQHQGIVSIYSSSKFYSARW